MTKLARTFSTLLTIAALASCSPDEPLINTFVDEWRLVSTTGSTDFSATVVPGGQPTAINPQNVDFGDSPSMVRFRNNIYVFSENRPWIVVFDSETLNYSDTIFTFGKLEGIADLCFANATTAYAVSAQQQCIGIIDLTTSTVAGVIPVAGSPRQIACLGNQMAVTLPDSNRVIIIDTRTNAIVDRISVAPTPWYVRGDEVANVFCVVSLGNGKVDKLPQTAPTITFISPSTREVLKTLDLVVRASEGSKQFPRGLSVSSTQFAYVPVQGGLLRVSTRTRSRVSAVQSDSFDLISYNEARAELICQRASGGASPDVVVYNEDGSEKKFTVSRSSRACALLGVSR